MFVYPVIDAAAGRYMIVMDSIFKFSIYHFFVVIKIACYSDND